jgi:hypothetical protein
MPTCSPPTPRELSRRQELSIKVERLQGTRAAVRRMKAELEELGQRRNLPLPHELMGMIFDFYVHLYGQLPEKLLLVCRSWNVLALSQPTLWTNLDPLGQFGLRIVQPWAGTFLQSRIARSNPAPLKVDFTALSWDMPLVTVKKVASTPTFRPRIQELVISRAMDMSYLVGPQPLLKSLTIGGNYPHPLDRIIANPATFKLDEKKLTTLRLFTPPKPSVWPDSLLQRIQTLEVRVTGDAGALNEYWTIIQKSTTLRALHITPNYGCNPTLSHPSVQHLSIAYPQWWTSSQMSLEEVRMPRLRAIDIDTSDPSPFVQLKLVETPVLSLRLICRPRGLYGDKTLPLVVSWVEGIVHFLRSTSHLQKVEISAPSSLVLNLMEVFEKDRSLCAELNSFVVLEPMGVATEADDKSTMEAKLDQLRRKAAAFMEERPSLMSTH